VSGKYQHLAAEGFNFDCRCFQILCLAAGDDYFSSGLGESKRYTLSDAAAASSEN
jgi:hypothetical protein